MEYYLAKEIADNDIKTIINGLTEFNYPRFGNNMFHDFYVLAKEEDILAGGIKCRIIGTWMEIEYLWVDEKRRMQGIGSSLLERAEIKALRSGCTKISLYTYSFQAPTFYLHHGYEEALSFGDYPNGSAKIYFVKVLE